MIKYIIIISILVFKPINSTSKLTLFYFGSFHHFQNIIPIFSKQSTPYADEIEQPYGLKIEFFQGFILL